MKKRATVGTNSYELTDEAKATLEEINWQWHIRSENQYVYDPLPQHRISEEGAWVMIIRPLPAIETNIDEQIRVGRFFYAIWSGTNTDDEGFDPDNTYRVKLQTPWGDVWLWPYEYAKVPTDDILAMWQAEELVFHPTDVSQAEFDSVVFYIRTKGIPLGQAAAMALGSVKANVGWFEPHPDLVDELEAFGKHAAANIGVLTEVNHNRRAAARRCLPSGLLMKVKKS